MLDVIAGQSVLTGEEGGGNDLQTEHTHFFVKKCSALLYS